MRDITLKIPLEYLFALERKGVKLGLEPTKDLLVRCGNPHLRFPIIQIAGTNGKGSTAAITSWILQCHGRHVGLFTSPHLYRFNERIRVDTVPVSDNYINQWIKENKDDIEEISATFFETNTVMALSYFRDRRVDIAVLETGLGGRLDATTAVTPSWTAITPVDLDHMEILGETKEAIAREKAGILKPSVPCFSSPQTPDVRMVIEAEAERIGSPLSFISAKSSGLHPLEMPGPHQGMNAQLGLKIARAALGSDFDPIVAEKAIHTAFWPGRYHVLQKQPRIVFDVAHNPHGVAAFLKTMQSEDIRGRKWLVLALQKDKRVDQMLEMLCPVFDHVVITQTGTRNFLPATEMAARVCSTYSGIHTEQDAMLAIRKTTEQAADEDFIAILGSHYLGVAVAQVFKILFDNF
ncbi:bifunctional folylpolyglutamate synthase/dihydrofolate synthase [Candidatus Neomarinimicrobiota bacterium]